MNNKYHLDQSKMVFLKRACQRVISITNVNFIEKGLNVTYIRILSLTYGA